MLRRLGDDVRPSRAKRFDVLEKRPSTIRRRRGETEADYVIRTLAELRAHEQRMAMLLLEKHRISPRDPNANIKLLTAVLRDRVPAFATDDGPKVGRPRTGITEGQRLAIDKAVRARQTVRSVCLRLVKGEDSTKERRAENLAAAYRRATK